MPRHLRPHTAAFLLEVRCGVLENVAAMACGAHESARIASRRAPRRRGLEDTTLTRAGAATATSRNDFFDPQFLSYCSLWTTNEAKTPRTTAWSGSHASLVCLLVAPAQLKLTELRIRLFAALGLRRNTAIARRRRRCRSGAPQNCPTNKFAVCCLSDHKQSTGSLGAHRSKYLSLIHI